MSGALPRMAFWPSIGFCLRLIKGLEFDGKTLERGG
jgi:hypothetical protein